MNMKLSGLLPAAIITAACFSSDSFGQVVLLGNLSGGNDLGTGTSLNTSRWKGVGFTTPAGQAYDISDVQLHLSGYTGVSSPSVGFYTDNAGVPSTTLVGSLLTNPGGNDGSLSSFTFTPSSTLSLSPSTTYWLVIKDTASATLTWANGNPNVTPSSAVGATYNGYQFTTTSGSSWSSSAVLNNFQIDATAVPEPVHYTLAGAGALVAFAFWRRIKLHSA